MTPDRQDRPPAEVPALQARRDGAGERLVVVGAGQAAAQLVEAAREYGWRGPIALLGEEAELPYQRPPLSKQYLAGERGRDWLDHRPPEFYQRAAVTPLLGQRTRAIDRTTRQVLLDDGSSLPYDRLALTTGAAVRRLSVSGAQERVHYLRTLHDVERIRAALAGVRRVVVIGGGFIGMEVAAVLIQRGYEVTVLEAGTRILARSVDPATAGFLACEHARHGVRIVTGASIAAIQADGAAHAVVAADGRCWGADLVIAGVGVEPRVELAAQAGLACDDGIVVDEQARTSDPLIVAAGDCTRHPNARLGRALRLETVHNAVEQARTAAATLCGRDRPYRQVPWVWSDQYDLRFQAAGAVDGSARGVVRGSIAERAFAVFMFDGERLLGVNCVNRPHDFAATRYLLNEGIALAPEAAADPGFDLRRLLGPPPRAAFDPPWPALAERRRVRA